MTWTIIFLVIGILLFVFGGMLLNRDSKKPVTVTTLCNKVIKLVAIILVAGCVARLVTPYYLTKVNPAILQEMVTNMQEQQQAEKNKAVRAYVHKNAGDIMANAPVLGNREAKNTIYVWTDFTCPFCRRVHGEFDKVLAERDDVRVVIKNFPIHPNLASDVPARITIAAKIQDADKSAALVEKLMTTDFYSQADLKDKDKIADKMEANVLKVAKELGLDVEQLKRDMNGEVVSGELNNTRDLAQRFEINGTPFVIINEQAFPGAIPYEQIVEALK